MPTFYCAQTTDLRLRALHLRDAADVFEYASDYQVSKFTHWARHTSIHDTYAYIHNQSRSQPLLWGIEHKKDKRIIGECGFVNMQYPCGEIYYALSRYYWGHGLATQAVAALMDYGFNTLHLERVEAWVIADNFGSHRVAEKTGMHHETTLYNHWYDDNALYDINIYVKERLHEQPLIQEIAAISCYLP